MNDTIKNLAPAVIGSIAMSSLFGLTAVPVIAGAMLIGGALLLGSKQDDIDIQLKEAFYACRLGVINKNGTPELPKLIKKVKKDYGFRLIYSIPTGLSVYSFLERRLALQTATNSELEIWEEDGFLHIRALMHRLPKRVLFKPFDIPEGSILPIPIGYSRAGLEIADLVDFPHLLVGGTTGAGKSVFLHGLTFTLCHYPHVKLYVIDLKKLEFVHYSNHVWLATTLPQALKVINSVRIEMFRRMELLKQGRVNNINKFKEKLPYIVLIIDEFAQLWPQKAAPHYEIKQKCHSCLHDILSLARAVGIHVVVSTQRPDRYILPGQLKANLPATLAFRTRNMKNAEVLDTPLAAYIPVELKGRAIWNWQYDREVQVMMFSPEQALFPPPLTKPEGEGRVISLAGEV